MDLQKGPSGILGWFALKVTGRNPPNFGDAVVPVVEVGDNYLASGELKINSNSTAPALTSSFSRVFTVPQGKCWRVISAGGYIVMNVADVALIALGTVSFETPNAAPFDAPAFSFTTPQLGTGARVFGTSFRPPVFLPSGISIVVGMAYSAPITVAGAAFAAVFVQEFDL